MSEILILVTKVDCNFVTDQTALFKYDSLRGESERPPSHITASPPFFVKPKQGINF